MHTRRTLGGTIMRDPIIEEIRNIRKQIEKECANDWNSLQKHFSALHAAHKVKTFTGKPKKILKYKSA